MVYFVTFKSTEKEALKSVCSRSKITVNYIYVLYFHEIHKVGIMAYKEILNHKKHRCALNVETIGLREY